MARVISIADLKKKIEEENYNSINDRTNMPISTSTRELQKKAKEAEIKFNTSRDNLNKFYKNEGVVTEDRNIYSNPNLFTIRNKQLNDSRNGIAPLLQKQNDSKKITHLPTAEQKNIEKFNIISNDYFGEKYIQNLKDAKNEYVKANSNYQYQKAIDDYKNANTLGKIGKVITSPLRGASSVLGLTGKYLYDDPKTGTSYRLPGYNEGTDTGISQYSGKVAQTINAVGGQIGKIGASAMLNSVMPYAGTVAYNTDMFKNTYNDALKEGYDIKKATSYATLSTATEFVTGKVLGASVGLFSKTGDFESFISKTLKKVIPNSRFNSILSSAISEGSEEFVQEFMDVFTRNLTLGEDNKISEDTFKNALYSSLIGALSGGTSTGIGKLVQNTTVKGRLDSQIDQIIYDVERIEGNTLSKLNQTKIANNVYEQYFENDGPVNPKKVVNDFIKDVDDRINNLKDSALKEKIDPQKSSELINSLSKLIKDRGYNIIFDSSLSKNVNGVNIDGNNIKINPNSSRAMEFIALHEVTHSVSTDTMKNLVIDYTNKNPELNKALESLKKTYKTNDVSDEVLADFSGQLFGNQEFINMLKNDEPSTFKKLYNGIISVANRLTGNTNETLFINDLKNKWEKAYRSSTNNVFNETKLSIQQDSKGNKFVNVDTNQDIFDGVSPKEYSNIAKKYILANFREQGLNLNNGVVQVTSKTANEYTHPKTPLPYYVKDSKMKASTELDNILTISKYQYSKPDDGRHPFAKDGWDYYKTTFQVGIKTFEGLINIGKNGNKKTLYDITNIKEVPYISTSDKSFSESLRTPLNVSNISQSNEYVKSSLPTSKYSMQEKSDNTSWQNTLEESLPNEGTKTYGKDVLLPTASEIKNFRNPDPITISKLKPEDATTTPKLPNIEYNKNYDGESKFFDNVRDKVGMLNDNQKEVILNDDEVKYYDKVTNKDSLDKAYKKLENGRYETLEWFSKSSNEATDIDVAEGWILMKQYADSGDNDGMVAVAKKLRDIGTKAGQTVQAFNIMERMTPEGMVKYAQSELSEAYEKMIKNKSKEWIDKYRNDFDLKPNEVQFIMDTMKEVSNMEDGYDKRVKLAEIQKIMTDKLPPEKGAAIKSWMRISMLFNPKTQVRNVVGNALIAPINNFADLFSSYADKLVSKKTQVRTTGLPNIKATLKGFKEGAYQATNDYRKGINTKDMEGNRFEIGQGKSFDDKKIIGKSLNRVEGLLNYIMDIGDRMFSQSSFENSLQNQMILNNTTEITQDMIDIARTESLQRTWNDNNNYTKFVLNTRKGLNSLVNIKGYGLGDVLIPFAKTPANLTKAIIDYSPAGLVSTIVKGNNLRKSLTNGQYTPQMQHQFVQQLGKATAGTMLYILGTALAMNGITSGESDEDKDVANFLKNTLGVSSYSIKIGDKSFTYDWAQPLAAPLSITANIVNKQKESASLQESIMSSLDTAGNILLEQSFLDSLNTVFSNNEGIATGIEEAIYELPSRAVPTFLKQIADMTDGTQRTTFEKNQLRKTAINKVVAKIPLASKNLAPTVDTMGREVQKYGGKNNLFNVFLNPANVNTENISESAREIYEVYKATGDKTVMPRVAEYTYKNKEGIIVPMSSKQRAEYQKKAGKIIEDNIKILLNKNDYKMLSNNDKADMITNIINYSYNVAKKETLNTEISKTYEKVYNYSKIGDITDYYILKNQDFVSDTDKDGNTISGSKKKKVVNYINSMKLSEIDKAILIKISGYSLNNYDSSIINYINSKNLSIDDKIAILSQMGYKIKNGRVYTS